MQMVLVWCTCNGKLTSVNWKEGGVPMGLLTYLYSSHILSVSQFPHRKRGIKDIFPSFSRTEIHRPGTRSFITYRCPLPKFVGILLTSSINPCLCKSLRVLPWRWFILEDKVPVQDIWSTGGQHWFRDQPYAKSVPEKDNELNAGQFAVQHWWLLSSLREIITLLPGGLGKIQPCSVLQPANVLYLSLFKVRGACVQLLDKP